MARSPSLNFGSVAARKAVCTDDCTKPFSPPPPPARPATAAAPGVPAVSPGRVLGWVVLVFGCDAADVPFGATPASLFASLKSPMPTPSPTLWPAFWNALVSTRCWICSWASGAFASFKPVLTTSGAAAAPICLAVDAQRRAAA